MRIHPVDVGAIVAALVELAEGCGIAIRRVSGSGDSQSHPGGSLVRLKGREIIFLDPTAAPADQLNVLAAALRGRSEIEDRFLPPELREIIDAGERA